MTTTKMGRAKRMGKWEAATAMIRLVQELREAAEREADTDIDNIVNAFLATVPAKVREEVRHG